MTNTPEPATPPPAEGPRRSGDRLLQLAVALFGIGILAVVAIFVWAIVADSAPGLWLYLLAMLTPVGFLLGLVFALWSGRRAR
ncbi:hypothetical protein [Nocardia asteroides]|uniref:Integral membrane protein n=1 Tax=Nocardia asteroides NBRC 15531 TaxID=1110697 RepID=U5E6S0_NOCAS|nr:hypothetical protein [Nocardia asteroides]TLF65329.1 hypothetical protein FEK33_18540 [Nocardia asteroides NBRC 15531]UGT47922.1 hypothetical protein LT345_26090 [Nocardia asteroides]GAD82925.1 hypothetical protein NCAST_13_02000 [Nocardia asteroides NBRC 15531]